MQQQQQQQQLRHGSSSHSITPAQGSDLVGLPKPDPGADDPSQVRGGSEDEENLTPAQSRRKAQNRAAYVFTFPDPVVQTACVLPS